MKYDKETKLNNIKTDVVRDGMFDDFKENLYVLNGLKRTKITIDDLTYPMLNCLEQNHTPHYSDKDFDVLDIKFLKENKIIY